MEITIINSTSNIRYKYLPTNNGVASLDLELHMNGTLDLVLSFEGSNYAFTIKAGDEEFKKEIKNLLQDFDTLLFPFKSTYDALIRFNLIETKNVPIFTDYGAWELNV